MPGARGLRRSVVWLKSSYQSPTASKGAGVAAQTTSSPIADNRSHVSRAPTGAATTTREGCRRRSAVTAASIVAPVASPSSIKMTVRSCRAGKGRPPR